MNAATNAWESLRDQNEAVRAVRACRACELCVRGLAGHVENLRAERDRDVLVVQAADRRLQAVPAKSAPVGHGVSCACRHCHCAERPKGRASSGWVLAAAHAVPRQAELCSARPTVHEHDQRAARAREHTQSRMTSRSPRRSSRPRLLRSDPATPGSSSRQTCACTATARSARRARSAPKGNATRSAQPCSD